MDDSLFTDPLYSLQSPSSAGGKIYTAGHFLTASARGSCGGRRKQTICRHLWEQLTLLFPGKANYHWLNGDCPVIIMSTTHQARVMRVEAFLFAWTRHWDSATCITYSTEYYQRLTLESWFTNLEQTPLNGSHQLPAPYKRLIDEIKQN